MKTTEAVAAQARYDSRCWARGNPGKRIEWPRIRRSEARPGAFPRGRGASELGRQGVAPVGLVWRVGLWRQDDRIGPLDDIGEVASNECTRVAVVEVHLENDTLGA